MAGEKLESVYEGHKKYGQILNARGEVICEYYYNPALYKVINFSVSDDGMPVKVITTQAYYNAVNTFQMVESALYFLIVTDFVAAIGIYLIKANGNKAKKAA